MGGDVEPWSRHNIGKTICRFDSADKLTTEARNFLASAFLGNDATQQMDIKISRDGMEPKAAADTWIEENQYTFDSFFGTLYDPDANQFVVVSLAAQGGLCCICHLGWLWRLFLRSALFWRF